MASIQEMTIDFFHVTGVITLKILNRDYYINNNAVSLLLNFLVARSGRSDQLLSFEDQRKHNHPGTEPVDINWRISD
jgi:hypothetical protein